MDRVRIALIGCGGIARGHLTAYSGMPELCELTHCVDIDAGKARSFAEQGHAVGGRWAKENVAGAVDRHEQVQRNVEQYDYDYGRQFARRGYIVLCPDARA